MGKFVATVTPDFNAGTATGSAYSDGDILFTWTPFNIPKSTGAVELKNIFASWPGIDGATGNVFDISLYFAKSINSEAPASFGTIHAAPTVVISNTFRRNLIGWAYVDASAGAEARLGGSAITSYNIFNYNSGVGHASEKESIFLQNDDTGALFKGDSTYSAPPEGYQTFWVAGIAHGAFNFGSEIHLDQGSHQAADTTGNDVTITVDQGGGSTGVANQSFQKGDILIGATGGPTMEITDMVSGTATELKVKNISEQIDDNEELVLQYPLRMEFGFEY
tara:strand:+ start:39 stop:872 length:834 start_codon:yes stop_codon:yes gene_type:complete